MNIFNVNCWKDENRGQELPIFYIYTEKFFIGSGPGFIDEDDFVFML